MIFKNQRIGSTSAIHRALAFRSERRTVAPKAERGLPITAFHTALSEGESVPRVPHLLRSPAQSTSATFHITQESSEMTMKGQMS